MVRQILNYFRVRADNLIPDLAVVALLLLALIRAIQTTGDLHWPYDLDQFRELGMAQSVLDNRYGTDHIYAGETVWYNPLSSTVCAALSYFSGVPISIVVTRAGAYLNLLAPIAFYILVITLFDRWTSLVATGAFLFAPIGDAPSWAAATYSPWIFSQNFAQGFFYLALVSYAKALESKSWTRHLVTGILLGLTFLGHTAPAVLLGIIMLVVTLRNSIARNADQRGFHLDTSQARQLILVVITAFVVSLPFTVSILFHYHLHVVNAVPSNWVYPPLALSKLSTFLGSFLSWFALVAGVGLVTVLWAGHGQARILLLTWLVVSCLALALNEIQQAVSPNLHLMFVPAHHFLFYLQALEDILFGVGLISICRFVAPTLPKLFAKRGLQIESQRLRPWIERALIGSSVACFLFLSLPSYFNRFDFTTARSEAIGFQERKDYIDAYRWILANSRPKDVFLSLSRDFDLSIIGPADRKTVVTCQPEFSNPYVSWTSRVETATKIVDKLASGDADAPAALSQAGVNFIITVPIEGFDRPQFSFLSKQFSEGDVSIYRVNIN